MPWASQLVDLASIIMIGDKPRQSRSVAAPGSESDGVSCAAAGLAIRPATRLVEITITAAASIMIGAGDRGRSGQARGQR